MSDIVERLRKDAEWHHRVTGASIKWNPLSEAADEIESLRSRLAELREAAGKVTCGNCANDHWGVPRGPCPDCADLRAILEGEK